MVKSPTTTTVEGDDMRDGSESRRALVAQILTEISKQFRNETIDQDQRLVFKERALEKHLGHVDLNVLLTEVKVCEEDPENDIPAGSIHIRVDPPLTLSEDLNGVYLPLVSTNFDISYVKMGNGDVSICFDGEEGRWVIKKKEAVLCQAPLPCTSSSLVKAFCLPSECPLASWQFLAGEEDTVQTISLLVLSPPDHALLHMVDRYRQQWPVKLQAHSQLSYNIESNLSAVEEVRDHPDTTCSSHNNNNDNNNNNNNNNSSSSNGSSEVTLTAVEMHSVSRARISDRALESMGEQGITHAEVDQARGRCAPDGFGTPISCPCPSSSSSDLHDVRPPPHISQPHASATVVVFNDYHTCCSEQYAVKARLVGDDVVAGERVFFVLRLDTLEILSFPMADMLLPEEGREGGREACLQQVIRQADRPPPPAGDECEDEANVRVILNTNGHGVVTVYKCVQERHFLAHLRLYCPRLIMVSGLDSISLVLVMSHDCHSILDLFRYDDSQNSCLDAGDKQLEQKDLNVSQQTGARRRLAVLMGARAQTHRDMSLFRTASC